MRVKSTAAHQVLVAVLGASSAVSQCNGQGILQPIVITFDGPPEQPPGTAYVTHDYYESGVAFRSLTNGLGLSYGFIRVGASPVAFRPDNGTDYLQADNLSTLAFSFTNGWLFSMQAVDLAEYSTVVPNAVTVHFVGYRHDGTIVTTDLTTDGIIDGTGPLADFQTFTFDKRLTYLDRVEIPTYGWSLDNLVVSIPEPAPGALLLGGALLLWGKRLRGKVTPKGRGGTDAGCGGFRQPSGGFVFPPPPPH